MTARKAISLDMVSKDRFFRVYQNGKVIADKVCVVKISTKASPETAFRDERGCGKFVITTEPFTLIEVS